MLSKDKKILEHLNPVSEFADTYFCSIYYKNKDRFMYSVFEKVSQWVEENGGKIKKISGKQTMGERKGFIVTIVFPCYAARDMKNIMATIY